MFPSIFFHLLFSKKHLVVIVIVMFCPVSGLLRQLLFYSKGSGHLTYPYNNFFPGGNLTEWHSTWLFPWSGPSMSQPFMFPSISSIFFSARSIWLWLFFHVLSYFWAGWVVVAAKIFIRRVPDISHTPRIISSLVWKSHRMAFNTALSWN